MMWQIIVIVLGIWFATDRWRRRKIYSLSSKLRSDRFCLPIVGHAYLAAGSDEDRMNMLKRIGKEALKYGGVTKIWLANRFYVVIAEPEDLEVVMKTCLEKDFLMKSFISLIGNGVILAPVPIWRQRRKFLIPTLSPKNLQRFFDVFIKQSAILVDQLKNVADHGNFSIWKYIATYNMDSVGETNLGIKLNSQKDSHHPFLTNFNKICEIAAASLCQPWTNIKFINKMTGVYQRNRLCRQNLRNIIDEIVEKKRREIKDRRLTETQSAEIQTSNLKTFLEMLIESSGGDEGYTNLELREETMVITIAGTDTSAVGVSFTLLLLSLHQDIQRKVHDEIKEVLDSSSSNVRPDDLSKLKYLEVVIKETLRLYPPAPLIVRAVEKNVTLPSSGITLVPGIGVMIHIWATNRNPLYWGEDAEEFRPERFLDFKPKHSAAFLSFSYGPRNCPGYQYAMTSMKIALASILRSYKVLPPLTETDHVKLLSDKDSIRVKYDIMLKHVDDFTIRLKSRDVIN